MDGTYLHFDRAHVPKGAFVVDNEDIRAEGEVAGDSLLTLGTRARCLQVLRVKRTLSNPWHRVPTSTGRHPSCDRRWVALFARCAR